MSKRNAKNERIKHEYQSWLEGAEGCGENVTDNALAAINEFEAFTKLKDFRLFRIQDARDFVRSVEEAENPKTGRPYAKPTLDKKLSALRKFVKWFAWHPEGRKRIGYRDENYFRLSRKDQAIARATRPKRVPSVDEIVRVLEAMPVTNETERRDRAIIAFTLLTCARVQAVITAKIKHVDLEAQVFHQDARDVETKFSKTFDTAFFPVGESVVAIVKDWITFLIDQKQFGPDDPLFPKPSIGIGDRQRFANLGLSRDHYASQGPIRRIFKEAFKANDLPPPNPHVFRDTVTQLGEKICTTAEELKAWSQNMGHEQVLTTLKSYGKVERPRQVELIKQLGAATTDCPPSTTPTSQDIEWLLDFARKNRGEG